MHVFPFLSSRTGDIKKIIARYGYKHQANKTIEELLELVYELIKVQHDQEDTPSIVSELADVIIMCTQLALYIGPNEVNEEIHYKIDRQLKRMEAERNGQS